MENNQQTHWYLYILETETGTLYTGITKDLEKRFKAHAKGKGAKYTRANKPGKFVYQELFGNRSEASKREAVIKKLSRSKKLELIRGFKLKEKNGQD